MASLPFPGMIPTRRVSCALFTIVKINKESPLYKIKDSADAQKFAIDIKEHARDLKNVIASLSTGDSLAEAFQKKIAVSDQNDIVDADYVGNGDSDENTNSFQMEIKKLASPQLNYGNYLKDDQLAFKPGIPSHIFDEMLHFFKVYKQLEGKETAVNEVMGHKAAVEIIKECIANYDEVYGEKYNNIDTGK